MALIAVQMSWAPAGAQDDTQIVNIRNAGASGCIDFVDAFRSPERQLEKVAFLHWAGAYATAASRSNELIDVFPLADTQDLLSVVALTCREVPAETFDVALRLAIGRLEPFWIRESTDILSLEDPSGKRVLLYAEAVAPIQAALLRLGFEIEPDGIYGMRTGTTVQELNRLNGFSELMVPDGALLYLLSVSTQ